MKEDCRCDECGGFVRMGFEDEWGSEEGLEVYRVEFEDLPENTFWVPTVPSPGLTAAWLECEAEESCFVVELDEKATIIFPEGNPDEAIADLRRMARELDE